MKYSIIEDIYYGRRGQGDTINASEEELKLSSESLKIYDELRGKLNDEQKELLEKLLNKDADVEAETAFNYYKEGLKIGLLLLAESLQD